MPCCNSAAACANIGRTLSMVSGLPRSAQSRLRRSAVSQRFQQSRRAVHRHRRCPGQPLPPGARARPAPCVARRLSGCSCNACMNSAAALSSAPTRRPACSALVGRSSSGAPPGSRQLQLLGQVSFCRLRATITAVGASVSGGPAFSSSTADTTVRRHPAVPGGRTQRQRTPWRLRRIDMEQAWEKVISQRKRQAPAPQRTASGALAAQCPLFGMDGRPRGSLLSWAVHHRHKPPTGQSTPGAPQGIPYVTTRAGAARLDRSPEALHTWLATLPPTAAIGVDTEFMRRNTFYPQLALLQLGWNGRYALVDPLAFDIGDALRPLLGSGPAITVMHSASEDLETLAPLLPDGPQVLVRHPDRRRLCRHGPGHRLPRTGGRAGRRGAGQGRDALGLAAAPAPASQCSYATLDVVYLKTSTSSWPNACSNVIAAPGTPRIASASSSAPAIVRRPAAAARLARGRRMAGARQALLRRLLLWRDRSARASTCRARGCSTTRWP